MPTEFDQFSDDYEDLLRDPIRDRFSATGQAFFHRRKVDVLLRFLRDQCLSPSGLSLLDVGCGQGDFLKLCVPHFQRLAGCDPSEKMTGRSGLAPLVTRLQPDPVEIPFDSNEFDVLTVICVLHHVALDARDALLVAVHRVLRPGGILCLIEHNPLNPVTRAIVRRTPVDANARLLLPGLSKDLVRRAGFDQVSMRYFLYLPEKLYNHIGWLERSLDHVPLGGQYATFCRKPPAATGPAGVR